MPKLMILLLLLAACAASNQAVGQQIKAELERSNKTSINPDPAVDLEWDSVWFFFPEGAIHG
ncbi:MAG: hypothetical protein AAFV72_03030 [Cyanobacteria bacterium J06635_1]